MVFFRTLKLLLSMIAVKSIFQKKKKKKEHNRNIQINEQRNRLVEHKY